MAGLAQRWEGREQMQCHMGYGQLQAEEERQLLVFTTQIEEIDAALLPALREQCRVWLRAV